jgi:hypothetical protein
MAQVSPAIVIPKLRCAKVAAQQSVRQTSPANGLIQTYAIHHLARLLALRRTRQNELTPNHANKAAKAIASPTRPNPALPAAYFAYSRATAIPPLAAMSRKMQPIASSHKSCNAPPAARAAVETLRPKARTIRLLPACRLATRATTPIFCAAETLLTARF